MSDLRELLREARKLIADEWDGVGSGAGIDCIKAIDAALAEPVCRICGQPGGKHLAGHIQVSAEDAMVMVPRKLTPKMAAIYRKWHDEGKYYMDQTIWSEMLDAATE